VRDRATKAQKLALVLLRQHVVPHKEQRTGCWTAIYELEDLFGVDDASQWKSVADAVKHCALAPNPAPMARYEYTEHAIHVFNGDLLTRIVKLKQVD
jgi:hypothetical protein